MTSSASAAAVGDDVSERRVCMRATNCCSDRATSSGGCGDMKTHNTSGSLLPHIYKTYMYTIHGVHCTCISFKTREDNRCDINFLATHSTLPNLTHHGAMSHRLLVDVNDGGVAAALSLGERRLQHPVARRVERRRRRATDVVQPVGDVLQRAALRRRTNSRIQGTGT